MKTDHPDANLLTAFGEDRLLPRERDELLAHVAGCADCREILALASRPVERAVPTRPVSQVWRWAAAAAAVALIVTATWGLRMALRSPEKAAIRMTAALKPAAPPAPVVVPTPAPEAKTPKREGQSMMAPKRFTAPESPAAVAPQPAPAVAPAPETPGAEAPAMRDEISKSIALPVAPAPAAIAERSASFDKLSKSRTQFTARSSHAFAGMAAKSAMSNPGVTWRINSFSIERSPDAGRTWEAIPVSPDAVFHAVAADGPNVWAGGSHGVLFHSSDGGLHWERIRVVDNARELTGGIVAIRLPQASEIVLETDSGEQWISRNGGINWRQL